jgi:GNAT superfamily N-acetyltransferase
LDQVNEEMNMQAQEVWSPVKDGYRVRPATLDDVEITVELLNKCSLEAIGVIDYSVNEVRNDWNSPGFNVATDTRLIFNDEGDLVAYVDVWTDAVPPVHPYVRIQVHPDEDYPRLGSALVNWAVLRASEVFEKVPEGARVSLRSHAVSTHTPKKSVLTEHGFEMIRHSWQMVIDLDHPIPPPEFPPGISVRNYDHEIDGEAVYRADYESFQDHWGFVEETFEDGYPRWLHHMLDDEFYDPKVWFLAMDGDKIAGASICRPISWEDPKMGWVRSLFVGRPWRRQGIALALLRHTFLTFQNIGKMRVGLGVDAESLTGATALYEKAGMRIHREYDGYELELRPGLELATTKLDQD